MGTNIIGGDRHKGGDRHNRWNLPDFQLPNIGGGWMAGWLGGILTENNATSWLHLASWNLPDSQLG